jgi:hypothetical protein
MMRNTFSRDGGVEEILAANLSMNLEARVTVATVWAKQLHFDRIERKRRTLE